MENQIAKPAPVPELNEIVTINERDLLIENYLPSLSNYQKVIKKFKIDLGKDKTKDSDPYKLSPNGNYTQQKDYFIFYNDNLKILIDLYQNYLKEYIKQNDFSLFFKKDNLEKVMEEIQYEYKPEADYSYNPIKLISGFISNHWYQDIIEKSNILCYNLFKLKETIGLYSDKISPETMCAVIVSEKLFDEKLIVKNFNDSKENSKCPKYFKEIESLKNKKIDDIEKLNLLDKKIDELKREIMPENSTDRWIDFCFILNIISEYLKNFERSLETKSDDLLKIMNIIRIKLDYYLLDYRFKYVENLSPILDIKIQRYKTLCDSPEMTSIFLEKGESRNFKRNLREEIDKKAKNIERSYQFQDISIEEIINIARGINFNRLEDIIDDYDRIIRQKKDELETKKNEYLTFIAKESLNFVLADNNNKNINYNNNGIAKQISSAQMNQFLISDNVLKEKKDKNTNTTYGEKKEGSEDDSEKLLEKRKNNLNSLGIDSKDMNNDIIDKISKSIQMWQNINKIKDDIEILEKKKRRIKDKFYYNIDFFDCLRIHIIPDSHNVNPEKNIFQFHISGFTFFYFRIHIFYYYIIYIFIIHIIILNIFFNILNFKLNYVFLY